MFNAMNAFHIISISKGVFYPLYDSSVDELMQFTPQMFIFGQTLFEE